MTNSSPYDYISLRNHIIARRDNLLNQVMSLDNVAIRNVTDFAEFTIGLLDNLDYHIRRVDELKLQLEEQGKMAQSIIKDHQNYIAENINKPEISDLVCKSCAEEYPDEDSTLRLVVNDGVRRVFKFNRDGSLDEHDSDGTGMEIFLQCPVCDTVYTFLDGDVTFTESPSLGKWEWNTDRIKPMRPEDYKYE